LKPLFDFYKELERDRLSLIFNGEVTDEITDGIIRITDYNVNNMEELAKMRKRVSFILLECFQNLVRHGKPEREDREVPSALFATRLVDGSNYVSSINLIDVAEIDRLKEKLTLVNTLEKDKLKALYLEVLNNTEISSRGGAGLGLIEIARRTGRPLGFDFETLDDKVSNFYLSIKLTGQESEDGNGSEESLRFTKEFDKAVKDSQVLMLYKGDFGKDSIMPIIQIIEERIKANEDMGNKAFFLILVELLQNVSRHSIDTLQKDGIFAISTDADGYAISVGNVVGEDAKEELSLRIDELNAMDADGLKQLYKRTLREGSFSDKGGAGLGLIEIARKSREALDYTFDGLSGGKYFFTFNVKF
jgi:hypothetical protein